MNPEETLRNFLAMLPSLSPSELGMLQQVVSRQQQSKQGASPVGQRPFTLQALNVPAEYLVNYHQWFFQAFAQEIFNPYETEDFYNVGNPEQLTNDASVRVSSSWNDTDIKTGQAPHIIVDCEGVQLSPYSIADASEKQSGGLLDNPRNLYQKCQMDIGMLIQVVAARPQEATNLANILLVSLAKTRKIVQQIFGLFHVSYPSMSPAAPLDGTPSEKFLASIRFNTTKHVEWHETITQQTFKNIIYRLVGVASPTDRDPIVQMILGSSGLVDPQLQAYLDRMVSK